MEEIKGDVQRVVKRRKDSGFTLIELMIVIAVIGILAVVLLPKMTNVKATANSAGVITNAKSIEAYVVANIDKWNRQGDSNKVATEIKDNFTLGDDKLTNPYTQDVGIAIAGSVAQGVVKITLGNGDTLTDGSSLSGGIKIIGYGKGDTDKVYEQTIKP